MKSNELVLVEAFSLDIQTEGDDLLQPLLKFGKGLGLGVAAFQVRNNPNEVTVFVLLDYYGKLVGLHGLSITGIATLNKPRRLND